MVKMRYCPFCSGEAKAVGERGGECLKCGATSPKWNDRVIANAVAVSVKAGSTNGMTGVFFGLIDSEMRYVSTMFIEKGHVPEIMKHIGFELEEAKNGNAPYVPTVGERLN